MKTRLVLGLAAAALSGCLQGPDPNEGASANVTDGDGLAALGGGGARGALMVGERALDRTSAERPALAYRFRSRDIWVVDVTAVAVDGGDPAVAIVGPLSGDGSGPVLVQSDARHGPLERLSTVSLEYDREYLAVVTAPPGIALETQITVAEDPAQTLELPGFVLGEPVGAEPPREAWERSCSAEQARLSAELGVNRVTGFDCGTPASFDAGGVPALASTAVLRFTTSWPVRKGESYREVSGLLRPSRREAFESYQDRCRSFLQEARDALGVVYAGATCGTPTEVTDGDRFRFDSAVSYFVFGRE